MRLSSSLFIYCIDLARKIHGEGHGTRTSWQHGSSSCQLFMLGQQRQPEGVVVLRQRAHSFCQKFSLNVAQVGRQG